MGGKSRIRLDDKASLVNLRPRAAFKTGDLMPDGWGPNAWGATLSALLTKAADEIGRLRRENSDIRKIAGAVSGGESFPDIKGRTKCDPDATPAANAVDQS